MIDDQIAPLSCIYVSRNSTTQHSVADFVDVYRTIPASAFSIYSNLTS